MSLQALHSILLYPTLLYSIIQCYFTPYSGLFYHVLCCSPLYFILLIILYSTIVFYSSTVLYSLYDCIILYDCIKLYYIPLYYWTILLHSSVVLNYMNELYFCTLLIVSYSTLLMDPYCIMLSSPPDQATLGLMQTPRCSLPDVSEPDGTTGRSRRSLKPQNKWTKRHLSWRSVL
jgi:hypothetical protein